jgi:hypothetical protein
VFLNNIKNIVTKIRRTSTTPESIFKEIKNFVIKCRILNGKLKQ